MTGDRPGRLLAAIVVLAILASLVAAIALLAAGPGAAPAIPDTEGPGLDAERAIVVRVIDGDTVVVDLGGRVERVRYVGIDAPEVATDGRPAECWAEEATEAHVRLVSGARLSLARDVNDRDRFGRLLRHAWLERDDGWLHVGQALVALGAAEARSYPPDTMHDELLERAEREARAASAGLWGECQLGWSVILGL
jgi:micrococcal nuclease